MSLLGALTATMVIASPLPIQAEAQTLAAPDTVVVKNGSLTLRGLLWKPEGVGPFPAVLYNHGSGPQSDLTRPAKLGPLFARHGYVMRYLFRRGAGLSADQGTDAETLMNRAMQRTVRRDATSSSFNCSRRNCLMSSRGSPSSGSTQRASTSRPQSKGNY